MKKKYIKPAIVVVRQLYSEGFIMWSTNIGSGDGTAPPPPSGAKPGGEWGDVWSEPTTDATTWGDAWAE